VELVAPNVEQLPGFIDAVRRGYPGYRILFGSTDAMLAMADDDPQSVIEVLRDRSTDGLLYHSDGTTSPRIPALFRWMWDGEFAGTIDLRWQPDGTGELPEYIPGHVGYGTVEWKRGRGYATQALAQLLPLAAAEGLTSIDLVTNVENTPSQHVVETNGGIIVAEFTQSEGLGGGQAFLWRISLA
jgi:predicted acetyltransferase